MKILEDISKDRKVYFATTVNPQSRINLEPYLINQGMVHEVNHEKLILSPDYPVFLDRSKLEENLFNTYRIKLRNNNDSISLYSDTSEAEILEIIGKSKLELFNKIYSKFSIYMFRNNLYID